MCGDPLWVYTQLNKYLVLSKHPTYLKVLVKAIDALGHFKQDNYSTVRGDWGCRVSEAETGTTFLIPNHKGFKLQ